MRALLKVILKKIPTLELVSIISEPTRTLAWVRHPNSPNADEPLH